MGDTQDRIARIVNELCGGNRSVFARSISITPAYAAQLYTGVRIPSDRTISDICRTFRVNEIWLRTGEGPMMHEMDEDQEMEDIISSLVFTDNKRAEGIRAILRAYWKLPEEAKNAIDQLIDGIAK